MIVYRDFNMLWGFTSNNHEEFGFRDRGTTFSRLGQRRLAYGNSRFCIAEKYTKPAHEHHLQAGPSDFKPIREAA